MKNAKGFCSVFIAFIMLLGVVNVCAEENEISTFGSESAAETVYFDSDTAFETLNYVDEGANAPALAGMEYISGAVNGSNTNITVQKIGTGDSATLGLRVVQGTKGWKASGLTVPISNAPDNGYIIADYKVRGYGTKPAGRKLGTLHGTGGAKAAVGIIDMSGDEIQYQNPNNTNEKVAFRKSTDGSCYIRTVLTKNANGKYVAYLYDLNSNMEKIAQYTTDFDTITIYQLISVYDAGIVDGGAELSYAKVYSAVKPEISDSNIDDITPSTSEIKLSFSKAVDTNCINADNIKLTDLKNSGVVSANVGVSEENQNDIIIKPNRYLDYNGEYEITLNNLKDVDFGFDIGEIKLKFTVKNRELFCTECKITDTNNLPVSDIDSITPDCRAVVTISNSNGLSKTVIALAVIRDDNGRRISSAATVRQNVTDMQYDIEIPFDNIKTAGAKSLNIYVWASDAGFSEILSDAPFVMNK